MRCLPAAALVLATSTAALAQPLSSAFTFQGEVTDGGTPANGTYDIQFALFDAASSGAQVGPTLCVDNLVVVNGRVVTSLDFGSVFGGHVRHLELRVRNDTGLPCSNTAGLIPLLPRLALTAAPNAAYALAAGTAQSATSALTASNATQLNGQPPSFYQNATNLTAGTLGASLLPATAARTDTAQTITGTKTFSVPASFTGAGVPFNVSSSSLVTNLNADLLDGLSATSFASAVHGHNAADLSSGTLSDARLSTNVALRTSSNTFTGANTFSSSAVFNGLVGIGTAAPGDLLHLFAGDAGTVLPNSNSRLIIEDDGTAYLNFLTPAANENGILFGTQTSSVNGGIIFNNPTNADGFQFRTGGNSTKMVITDTGNVGIGTTAPSGKLTVSGTATDGTVVLPSQSISTAENFEESFTTGGGIIEGTPSPTLSTSWSTLRTMTVTCESSSGAVHLIATVEVVNPAGLGSNTIDVAITKNATPSASEVRHHTVIGDTGADSYAVITVMDIDATSVAGANTYRLMVRERNSADTELLSHHMRATYSR